LSEKVGELLELNSDHPVGFPYPGGLFSNEAFPTAIVPAQSGKAARAKKMSCFKTEFLLISNTVCRNRGSEGARPIKPA
jgi:hypothetical protein